MQWNKSQLFKKIVKMAVNITQASLTLFFGCFCSDILLIAFPLKYIPSRIKFVTESQVENVHIYTYSNINIHTMNSGTNDMKDEKFKTCS